MGFLRRRPLRPVSEAAAYARCHGDRGTDIVRVSKLEPRRPRYETSISGEMLRRAFEAKLRERDAQTG